MKIWKEEVFGPVLLIVSFENDEEALKLANDTKKFGLGAYIFSEDKKKSLEFAKKLKAGMVGINNSYYFKPHVILLGDIKNLEWQENMENMV